MGTGCPLDLVLSRHVGCKQPTPGEYFSSARTTSIATVALERSQAFSTAEGCKQPWCEPHSALKALGTDVEVMLQH